MYFEENGERVDVPPRMQVRGSGSAGAAVPVIDAVEARDDPDGTTVVRAGDVELVVARRSGATITADVTLTWSDRDGLILVGLRRVS